MAVALAVACGGQVSSIADSDDVKGAGSATHPSSVVAAPMGQPMIANFSSKAQWRAFTFSVRAGDTVSVFADGRDGLDTVLSLYAVDARTGLPAGRACPECGTLNG